MLQGNDILGKDVLSRLDGQKIGSIKDIVISKDHARIVAFIVETGGLFSAATAVAMENVVSFGKDAIVITDSKAVVRVDHFPAVKEIMDDRDGLVGKQVLSEAGDRKGKIEDIYFDESTGSIVGLEMEGRLTPKGSNAAVQLRLDDIVSIGPDAVVINRASVPGLEAQATGGPRPLDTPATAIATDVPATSPTVTSPMPSNMDMPDADPGDWARVATSDPTSDAQSTSGATGETSAPVAASEATVQLPSDPDMGRDN